jgi:hypothetical protein
MSVVRFRVDAGAAPRVLLGVSVALRWLAWIAVVAVVAAVALWVHLFEFNAVNTWDAAQLLTQSKLLQRGLLLYRDVWEMKPPGVFLYHAAVFAVLPVEVWSVRLADYLLYVVAGVLFYRLCAVEARWPLALVATAVWLYFAHHPIFNNQGFYTEEYLSMCAIAAVAAATRYWYRGGFGWVVVGGVAVAGAVLFKHPGAACGLPVAILVSGRRPLLALPLLALSFALPLALIVAYFWWQGALTEFIDCNFYVLLAYGAIAQAGAPTPLQRLTELGQRTWQLFGFYPQLLWPVLFGIAVCVQRPNRFRVAALTWLAADLIMIAAQKRYYEHYYIQLFASGILVGTLGAAWLLQRQPGERWLASAGRLALCVLAVALAWPRVQQLIAERRPAVQHAWNTLWAGPAAWLDHPGGNFEAGIGRYVKEHTTADDHVFVYADGTGAAIYWTAERTPASRYLYPSASQLSRAREAEQRAELERTRPAYMVIAGGPHDLRHFTPFLLANYTLDEIKWVDYRVELWARNDVAPFSAGTLTGLVADPRRGGLVLAAPSLLPAAEPALPTGERRGSWTSPVIEVPDDPKLRLDWSPRAVAGGNAAPPAMGVSVWLRSGQTPDLDRAPWVEVEDDGWPRMVDAQRYAQIRCDVWGPDDGRSPVLRWVSLGRYGFQLADGPNPHGRASLPASRTDNGTAARWEPRPPDGDFLS